LWYIFSYFGNLSVYGIKHLEGLRGPLIIVANHKDYIDSFLIGAVLKRGSPLIPLRYMVADGFFRNPFSRIPLIFLGTYPAHAKQGMDKSLEMPLDILNKGGIVAIFPEGKRIQEDGVSHARPGAAVLALETNAPVVPVAIRGGGKIRVRDFFMRKHSIAIAFGRPFRLRNKVSAHSTIFDAAEVLVKEIRNVYARIPECAAERE